jgi:uncharacterized membrane protein
MTPETLAISHILGLPAHPLLVHGAVVLVHLGAVAFLVAGLREAWRRAYYLPAMLITVAGGVFAFLAKESGQRCRDRYASRARRWATTHSKGI